MRSCMGTAIYYNSCSSETCLYLSISTKTGLTSETELSCFLWSAPAVTVEQTLETPVIREAMAPLWRHRNGICRYAGNTLTHHPIEEVIICWVSDSATFTLNGVIAEHGTRSLMTRATHVHTGVKRCTFHRLISGAIAQKEMVLNS